MKKSIASILCIVLCIISMTSVVYASGTTLKIDDVSCSPNELINVPITISSNTGIAGAVIKISYDNNLELVAVNRGNAFSSLAYTPPAKLTSNPITLLWDGMEADDSNGVIATLQFRAPNNAGVYNISASYDVGGIYDGDMEDINVVIDNGAISVKNENSISVSVVDKVFIELTTENSFDGTVYIALYDHNDVLLEIETCTAKESITSEFKNMNMGKYIKVFWWDEQTLEPYCDSKQLDL